MADTGNTDLIRLLCRFGVRALVLAVILALAGETTLALALGLVGFGLLFAPVGPGHFTSADVPARREPPDSPAPAHGPRDEFFD